MKHTGRWGMLVSRAIFDSEQVYVTVEYKTLHFVACGCSVPAQYFSDVS